MGYSMACASQTGAAKFSNESAQRGVSTRSRTANSSSAAPGQENSKSAACCPFGRVTKTRPSDVWESPADSPAFFSVTRANGRSNQQLPRASPFPLQAGYPAKLQVLRFGGVVPQSNLYVCPPRPGLDGYIDFKHRWGNSRILIADVKLNRVLASHAVRVADGNLQRYFVRRKMPGSGQAKLWYGITINRNRVQRELGWLK